MRLIAAALFSFVLLLALWRVGSHPAGYAVQDRIALTHEVSRAHPVGTDELGRDRATRLSLALLLGLAGAVCASAVGSSLALGLGSLAAWGPPPMGRALLYSSDLFLTLPWLFLLMLVRSVLPLNLSPLRSEFVTFSLLAVLGAPAFLRLHHGKLQGLLSSPWMLQARASGLSQTQIFRATLPHLRPLFWTQFLLYIPACLMAEANLGTLGLGLSEPLPSLGTFLANLQSAALTNPSRLALLPVAVLVLALAMLEVLLFGAEA